MHGCSKRFRSGGGGLEAVLYIRSNGLELTIYRDE